jgi:molecular chaperone GrpE
MSPPVMPDPTTMNTTPDAAADAAHPSPASHDRAGQAAGSADADAAAARTAPEQLAELQARHAEVSDAYLRAKAEAENIRRRAEEDIAKARKFAIEAFAESLLPVVDSLQSATAIPNASPQQILEGVHATLRQLTAALEKNRVVPVAPPSGTRFDPHRHQAISVVPADQEPNTVVAVLQSGFLINERVLRPALVTVAGPK